MPKRRVRPTPLIPLTPPAREAEAPPPTLAELVARAEPLRVNTAETVERMKALRAVLDRQRAWAWTPR